MLRYSHLALLVTCVLALVTGLSFSAQPAQASLSGKRAPSIGRPSVPAAGCIPETFTNKVLGNGLGDKYVNGVYASGNMVYAATGDWMTERGGLSISTDGGNTFVNKTTADGLPYNVVNGVYASGMTVFAATDRGLAISTDGGNTFTERGMLYVWGVYAIGSTVYAATDWQLEISRDGGNTFINKTTADGLGDNHVYGVYAVGNTVYAATGGGISISTDGGDTFVNRTTADGLGSNNLYGVYAVGNTVYAATDAGLSVSTDGGNTFINRSTADGLGRDWVSGVYAIGSTVYAATLGGGLSISTDGGNTFTKKTTANGLASNTVGSVYADGSTVYAATIYGLSISTDGGSSFSSRSDNSVRDVYVTDGTVYVANEGGGVSISTDGGSHFINKDTAKGLGTNSVWGIYAKGSTVYAATNGGLSISTDGGDHFANRTMADGLGSSYVNGVYATGSTVYGATGDLYQENGGVSISSDGGGHFVNRTSADGLGLNTVWRVYADGSKVYAATQGGLSISTDGGNSFVNKTSADGLGNGNVWDVYAEGNTVYVGTSLGLSISTDGGNHFVNRWKDVGLGSIYVRGVYAVGSTVYAATSAAYGSGGGVSISTDGGSTFTNKTTSDGLGSNDVWSVFAEGNNVYAATAAGLSIGTCDPAVLPAGFHKRRPVNGATGVSTNPTLTWGNSDRATVYEYCIDTTDDNACDTGWVDNGVNTTVSLKGLSYGSTYFWQVRARDGDGATEADSGAWWNLTVTPVLNDYFDSATQISSMPYSITLDTTKATTASDDPTFACASTKGAASVWFGYTPTTNGALRVNTTGSNYDTILAVWQGAGGSLTNVACNDNKGSQPTSTLSAIVKAGQKYYVEAAGKTVGGSLKLAATFTATKPAVPKLLSPANSTKTTNPTPVLDWTDSPGAAYYQVEVRKGSNTGALADSAKPAVPTYTTKSLAAGLYYWRAGACNAAGCSFSAWWSLTILKPVAPVLQSPGDGSTVSGTTVVLDWSDSTDASSYALQVRQGSTSGPYAVNQSVPGSGFTTGPLLSGRWYYWRVRACSAAGCSAWTKWWKFKTP